MLPSGSSQLPGGRHEGVAVEMCVSTFGSPRRPVASAPAPGAVGAWTCFLLHGSSTMFIFTMFYIVFVMTEVITKKLMFQWVVMGFAVSCDNLHRRQLKIPSIE